MIDPLAPAAYLVANKQPGALDIPPGTAFAYILAADGLYKKAWSRHLVGTVPVARWARSLPGLSRIPQGVLLIPGRLPASLLDACLAHARRAGPIEVLYQFYLRGRHVHVSRPRQVGSAGRIQYATDDIDPASIVLDLHSHHHMAAGFSPTDNRDETGLRLYAVIGRLDQPIAHVRFRVGVYGVFADLPATAVFAGTINLQDRHYG